MGWFGRWIGRWSGRWFGSVQQQQAGQATSARRFGRIISASGILFSNTQYPSIVSAGGVILTRQATDDYVRFRVPDTQCPSLPRPNEPLDEGVAENAEPGRWVIQAGTPSTSDKWVMLESTDKIGITYAVYSSDFVVEVVSDYVSRTGNVTGTAGYWAYDGVCLLADKSGYTYGIGVGWARHIGYAKVPWGGGDAGRAVFYFIAQGSSQVALGSYLIPNSQTNVRYRIQRQGSQLRFGWLDASGNWQYSSWFSAPSGELQFYFEGIRITAGGPDV